MDVETTEKKLARAKEAVAKLNAILAKKKRKKENDDKMQAGISLQLCGFGLEREDIHIGCMLYAMKAIEENPELEQQFQVMGSKMIEEKGKKDGR